MRSIMLIFLPLSSKFTIMLPRFVGFEIQDEQSTEHRQLLFSRERAVALQRKGKKKKKKMRS